jgi:hypothetical protein
MPKNDNLINFEEPGFESDVEIPLSKTVPRLIAAIKPEPLAMAYVTLPS